MNSLIITKTSYTRKIHGIMELLVAYIFMLCTVSPCVLAAIDHGARYDIGVIQGSLEALSRQIDLLAGRVSNLEGIPKQLVEAKNTLATLKITTELNQAKTDKIKEETFATTKLLGESVASTSENIKLLEIKLSQSEKALEEYKNQAAAKEEVKKILEQRQARFHRSLKELFTKGVIIEDSGMESCFKRACELSINFCISYKELKKFHDNWNKFMVESDRFAKLFWELLAADIELQNIIDKPMQLTIARGTEGGDDLLALGYNPNNEL